jgi:hypothetical protein
MSSSAKVVELTGKDTDLTSTGKLKGEEFSVPEDVWMLIYQMETGSNVDIIEQTTRGSKAHMQTNTAQRPHSTSCLSISCFWPR